ncbi:MAG TPA: hypothetical protein VGL93_26135 [Streptosporangiaceae bacterium]
MSDDATRAHAVADAALACPGVAALTGGPYGAVATYLPGGRIEGVALRDTEIEVRLVARYGIPLPEVAARVRAAVGPLAGGRDVAVVIDDLS